VMELDGELTAEEFDELRAWARQRFGA
jgi:hypothetical protein